MLRNLGEPSHLIILAILLILIFGWKRLPDAARSIGRSMRVFKSEMEEMKTDGKSSASGQTVPGETVPGTAQPSTAQPSTAQPSTAPPMSQPSTPPPSMAQPATPQPSMAQPSMAQPQVPVPGVPTNGSTATGTGQPSQTVPVSPVREDVPDTDYRPPAV